MKNLSYYEKLGFEDPFSWNQEDFSGFLVWDEVEALKSIIDLESKTLQRTEHSMRKYNKYKFVLNFYDRFFQKRCFKNNKNRKSKKILFQGTTFSKLILESKKHHALGLIVQTGGDRLFSLKNFIGYLNINDLHQYVYYYMKEKNIDYLYQLVKKMEEKLRFLRPNYVVLWGDVCSVERSAIILVCKKLGILILEIQLGMLQSEHFLNGASRERADYLLVWGQYFKDLYAKANVKKTEKVYILGYPYDAIYKSKAKFKKKKKCIIYYLGQPYELYNKELLDLKLRTLVELNKMCEKLNIEFFYRPHPRDDRNLLRNRVPNINFTPKGEVLLDTIAKGDIFISFDSTSLIEAGMRLKLSLQLMNYPIGTDNFEKLGACAKSFNNIEQLSAYLQEIIKDSRLTENNFRFNNNFVETRYNPGERFVEILNQISRA